MKQAGDNKAKTMNMTNTALDDDGITAGSAFGLRRNAFGKLVLTDSSNVEHVGVVPVRAFPVQAPDEGISMMSEDGHEIYWIERLADLPPPILALVSQELEGREFMPVIGAITSVSSFSTPCTWHVETDRGRTSFVLRGEEDIRRIGSASLLVADNHGINFLIRDPASMDRASKKILDRFL